MQIIPTTRMTQWSERRFVVEFVFSYILHFVSKKHPRCF